MQWSKPVIGDLRRERRGAEFDVWELTRVIYGSDEALQAIENQVKLVGSDPALAQQEDLWWMSREERYVRACERGRAFVRVCRQYNIPFEERGSLELLLGEDLFILLHDIMFVPTLINLADDEQQSWWLDKAKNYDILGTYAQTELTHGSNVRGIATTATFMPPDKDFPDGSWLVHTPKLEAVKWWPGGMAKSCNTVVLMAQVVVNGKSYGPHPFFFPIRDWQTHESLPGIQLRDIGQKIGYNGIDNGAMWISNVRIPRRNLLMRYVDVDVHGNYSKKGNQKLLFGTMTYTRLKISYMSGFNLAKACTTAIRYSAVRRQFELGEKDFDENVAQRQLGNLIRGSPKETQVLDYSSQQFLLFPQLAAAYAMHFAAQDCEKLYWGNIEKFKNDDFSGLMELHVTTSTFKAVNTMIMSDGMEQCRKSMGGHGFMNAAGVGPQYLSALPQATYEGDFVVLSIQVGTQILKLIGGKMSGKEMKQEMPWLAYVLNFDPFAKRTPMSKAECKAMFESHDFDAMVRVLQVRANFLNYTAANDFQNVMMELKEAEIKKKDLVPQALDEVKTDFIAMTYSHAYVLMAMRFRIRLEEMTPTVKKVLVPLFELFVITAMTRSYDTGGGFGEFCAASALEPNCLTVLNKIRKDLLKQIRPQAVPLVDGWNIPDFLLNSCLGRYDGRVYESLWESTQFEPLNKTDVHEGYYKHLQYLLHGDAGAPKKAKL
jgi:acyl-CoA oxidase